MYLSKENQKRSILFVLLLPLLALNMWWGLRINEFSAERAQLKKDYSELNNIQYGLLSVDRWRDNITDLVSQQIDQFKLRGNQEEALRESLDEILNALITQAAEMMNEKQDTVGGKIKKFAFNTFVNVDKIRERVPEFSKTIIDEVKHPKNRKKFKNLANDKLDEFAEQTYDDIIEQSNYDKILAKYDSSNVEDVNVYIINKSDQLLENTYVYAFQIMACMFLFLMTWILIRNNRELYKPMYIMSVILALIVLMIGVTTPMIEIDARIKEINFLLLNKTIQFRDQVIFFQSKSIMDVVDILISTKKPDSVLVGGLILIFSVIFPITKLICTEIYLLGTKAWKNSRIIQFFAFESSKWSMADVMVVAIFMAYIGFKGILDSQLTGMNMMTPTIASITTNQTSLQPGFILFVAFVLFGLILSQILKYISKTPVPKKLKHQYLHHL